MIARTLLPGQFKINFALVEIDPNHFHCELVTQAEYTAGALANHAMLRGFMSIIIFRQGGNVNQPLDVEFVEHNKQAKAGHSSHHTGKLLAYTIN